MRVLTMHHHAINEQRVWCGDLPQEVAGLVDDYLEWKARQTGATKEEGTVKEDYDNVEGTASPNQNTVGSHSIGESVVFCRVVSQISTQPNI